MSFFSRIEASRMISREIKNLNELAIHFANNNALFSERISLLKKHPTATENKILIYDIERFLKTITTISIRATLLRKRVYNDLFLPYQEQFPPKIVEEVKSTLFKIERQLTLFSELKLDFTLNQIGKLFSQKRCLRG